MTASPSDANTGRSRRWVNLLGVAVLVALIVLAATTLDLASLREALSTADPRWMVAAFLAGMLTYVTGGLTLVALVPERSVRLGAASAVQLAARVVGVIAPAGIGPAAVNLRFLHRRGLEMPLAVATVTLVQVCQFLVTVTALVVVAVLTGATGRLVVPTEAVVWTSVAVVAAVALVAVIAPLRRRVLATGGPALRRAWPRLVWLVGRPGRLALAATGSLAMSAAFIAAFGLSLAAFGHSLPVTHLALTYMLSSTLGSVVPAPGGIGPVEAALTGGLTLAGVPLAVAVSAAVLFRVVTFWLPIPLGWLTLRALTARGTL